jgi:asparagine synthase (glutamine-hydrolysing)
MCGIAGLLWRDGQRAGDATLVGAMCDALRHRGPDDEGVWADGPAAIGMRRLSIIDLAGGHQPIFNETGRIGVVMNGEIYNYRALREQLLARGHVLRTHSDTEVLVHLYEDYGEHLVEHLRGMFAFAIWDADRGTLLLGRDHFGIKPLYVAEGHGFVAFASELKALVAVGATSREIDGEALDLYLQLGYVPAPWSIFRDVRKLLPAHTLTIRRGESPRQRCYWQLPTGTVDPGGDVVAYVREALDDAVAAHLVADVPIAAFLSGGIDSSAVVSGMAGMGYASRAFTARYHGSGAEGTDEVPLARALANRYGLPLTVVDVEPAVQDLLSPICHALDEPLADESAVPTWILSQAVAASYKVVLAGTGGDELFGGYRRHRGLALADRWNRVPPLVRRGVSRLAQAIPEPRNGSLSITRLKRFVRAGNGTPVERYADFVGRLGPAEFAAVRPQGRGDRHTAHFGALGAPGTADGALRSALRIDYGCYLPDDILALSDRVSSAHSLEVRVPFVDVRLVERLFTLPDHYRIRGSVQKWVLREAVRPRLTPNHFTAPKRGFVGPTASWLRNEMRAVLEDELAAARMQRLGLFDVRAIGELLQAHTTRRANHESTLWALMVFSLWHGHYVEQQPAVPQLTVPRLAP